MGMRLTVARQFESNTLTNPASWRAPGMPARNDVEKASLEKR